MIEDDQTDILQPIDDSLRRLQQQRGVLNGLSIEIDLNDLFLAKEFGGDLFRRRR